MDDEVLRALQNLIWSSVHQLLPDERPVIAIKVESGGGEMPCPPLFGSTSARSSREFICGRKWPAAAFAGATGDDFRIEILRLMNPNNKVPSSFRWAEGLLHEGSSRLGPRSMPTSWIDIEFIPGLDDRQHRGRQGFILGGAARRRRSYRCAIDKGCHLSDN
jgi:hypothetical protein